MVFGPGPDLAEMTRPSAHRVEEQPWPSQARAPTRLPWTDFCILRPDLSLLFASVFEV